MELAPNKYLGKLCPKGHDYEGTGKSLRYQSPAHACVQCTKDNYAKWLETNRERHNARLKDKYTNDPVHRALCFQRQRRYRAKRNSDPVRRERYLLQVKKCKVEAFKKWKELSAA